MELKATGSEHIEVDEDAALVTVMLHVFAGPVLLRFVMK